MKQSVSKSNSLSIKEVVENFWRGTFLSIDLLCDTRVRRDVSTALMGQQKVPNPYDLSPDSFSDYRETNTWTTLKSV